jgi:large subunit ribosomal protein L27
VTTPESHPHDVFGSPAALLRQKHRGDPANVGRGGDDTLFALEAGAVQFGTRRGRRVVNIVPGDDA